MGKFNQIPKLTGIENYYEWRPRIQCLLQAEGVYTHVSNGTDPADFVQFASVMPTPAIPGSPTPSEQEEVRAWIKEDGLAKTIILQNLGKTVLSTTPHDISIYAREIWDLLAQRYGRGDFSLRCSIRRQLESLKLNSPSDASAYVAAHVTANERLAGMGAKLTDVDMVFNLLLGLPRTGGWPVVKTTILSDMQRNLDDIQAYNKINSGFTAPFSTAMRPFHIDGISLPPRAYGLQDAVSTILYEAALMLVGSAPV